MNIQKRRLIEALAEILVDKEAAKSIHLQLESQWEPSDPRASFAKEWANLRGLAGITGWGTTRENAIAKLEKLLK